MNFTPCHRKFFGRVLAAAVVLMAGSPLHAQTQWDPNVANTNSSSEVSAEMAGFGSRGVHVHDPSTVVKCGNEFWVFYTGRGVPSYHSADLVKWEAGPRVFTNAPAWTDQAVPKHRGAYFWAPDIIHLG